VSVVDSKGGSARDLPQASGRLSPDRPSFAINTPITDAQPGDRLRVRVISGKHGPVQDRVLLKRAVVTTARPAR
jgi:hypothetical protein